MTTIKYINIFNNQVIALSNIPVHDYGSFAAINLDLMKDNPARHCVNYFGFAAAGKIKLICCIADDDIHEILVSSSLVDKTDDLASFTAQNHNFEKFEREIHENFGIGYSDHPWLKPLRYAFNRADMSQKIENYPFYKVDSEELHEVGVGPVHAGIIEPGHFRFICNGEKVLHLEIQFGYQYRGIEKLFIEKNNALQRCVLSESIAGDTSVGHALAHSQLIESLAGIQVSESLQIERCIALEMERLAIHIGDTAALCGDVAYQLGQVACEALRTTIINTTQFWCGNRFGKGLVRPGGSNYPLSNNIVDKMLRVLDDTGRRYSEVTDLIYYLPSVLGRFDDIGILTRQQALSLGAVGMAARTCGILRDIRKTHPFQYYKNYPVRPVIIETGDVLARGMERNLEARESVKIIRELIDMATKNQRHQEACL